MPSIPTLLRLWKVDTACLTVHSPHMPVDDGAQTGPDALENMESIGNIRNGGLYIN